MTRADASSNKYRPKGSMCLACAKKLANCSALDFSSMQVMARDKQDGMRVVKCSEFRAVKKNSTANSVCAHIENGHIPCECGEYTHIVSSRVTKTLPKGYSGEMCPRCHLWMCRINLVSGKCNDILERQIPQRSTFSGIQDASSTDPPGAHARRGQPGKTGTEFGERSGTV